MSHGGMCRLRIVRRAGSPRGVALVAVLLFGALVTSLGLTVALLGSVETLVSARHEDAQALFYAADGGLQQAMADLARTSDWSAVVAAPPVNVRSDFVDGTLFPSLADGTRLDLTAWTVREQAASDRVHGDRSVNPNAPAWRLYLYGQSDAWAGSAGVRTGSYVVAWVGDDPADADGDNAADSNDRLVVRAEAFGVGGGRRGVEAVVERWPHAHDVSGPPVAPARGVRLVSWKEIR